jgi:hypothetical protein
MFEAEVQVNPAKPKHRENQRSLPRYFFGRSSLREPHSIIVVKVEIPYILRRDSGLLGIAWGYFG